MRLTLVTYNIHKGIGGLDRRYRLERVHEVLAGCAPDIACLQEVDQDARRSDREIQVDLLATALGLRHRLYVPHVAVRGGGHHGNAILSRFPIAHPAFVDLTIGRAKPRNALQTHLRVRAPGGRRSRTVHVFAMHLGLTERLRRAQLTRFLASKPFAALHPRAPVIVAGDLNDVWGSLRQGVLAPAGFHGPARPPPTFPAWAPIRALDGIYVRGDIQIESLRRVTAPPARWASDHLPVVAELRLR